MTTDDERRRAAEGLRKLSGLDYCKDPRYAVELCSDAIGANHDNGYSWDKMLVRLADLIEPCDMSQNCRDGVACDREALLELAQSMMVRLSWLSAADAARAKRIARRIREACGEVVA